MKKLIAVLLLCVAPAVMAQHHRHHGHHVHGHGKWIVPALVGGTVVYLATRPQPAPAPTVVYTMPPPAPLGYQWENIHDAACNCLRSVLVPVQYGARSPINGLQ